MYPLALEKTGRRFVIPIIRTRSFGRYPARASYLVLEIGLSVMRAAADTLSKLTSDISVFHRDLRFDVISIIRNRLLVSTFALWVVRRRAQVVLDPCSHRKNHVTLNETLSMILPC